MDCYEFVCAGSPSLPLVTADPDLARMPRAAQLCRPQFVLARSFRLGDGSNDPALDAVVKARVAGARMGCGTIGSCAPSAHPGSRRPTVFSAPGTQAIRRG
jgi:hypothetical protein